ncbi:MAG: response regulator [Oscillospiraceae bacterium]|nr:response regulator [Oscillospiraceae bacterium]
MPGAELDYIKNIGGLMIGRNSNLNQIARNIDIFIDVIPGLTETVQKNMPQNSSNVNLCFGDSIKKIVSLLEEVKAVWLLSEGRKLLRAADSVYFDLEMCKKLLPPFTTNVLSLSISMQTAMNRSYGSRANSKKIEMMGDTVKNLSAIKTLLETTDPAYAARMLEDMTLLKSNETAKRLILELREDRDGSALIDELIDMYNAQIEEAMFDIAGVARHNIMMVDDRPEILETVGGYLRGRYKVFPLTSGIAALKAIEKQKIDLFILDIDMPEMDGITLAKKIRSLLRFRTTPIIILTSNAEKEYVLAAMQAGANDFIIKPAIRDMLVAKIADFLKAEEG